MNGRGKFPPVALRIAMVSVLVIIATGTLGDTVAHALQPMLRWVYELVDQDHRVLEFEISQQTALGNTDRVYRLKVAPHSVVLIGTRAIHMDPRAWAKVSLLVSYLWQPLMLAAVTIAAFDVRRPKEWLMRTLCLAPLLVLIAMLDLPMVMWAEVWLNYKPLLPEDSVSPLLHWSYFLQHGGRLLLGAVAGLLAVRIARRT